MVVVAGECQCIYSFTLAVNAVHWKAINSLVNFLHTFDHVVINQGV